MVITKYLYTETHVVITKHLYTETHVVITKHLYTETHVVITTYLYTETHVVITKYLSTEIAVKLRIDAVQHMTSSATHVSHRASPSSHMPLFTCKLCNVRSFQHTVMQFSNLM